MRCSKRNYTFSWPYDEKGRTRHTEGIGSRGPLGFASVSHYTQAVDVKTTLQIRHKHDFIGFVINLGSMFRIDTHGFSLTFGRNIFNLLSIPKGSYDYRVEKGKYSVLTVRFTAAYLKIWKPECAGIIPFLKVAKSKTPISISLSQAVTPEIRLIIDYILKSGYTGEFKKLFFHAKTIDIVQSCLKEVRRYSTADRVHTDIEKITQARQLLERDLQYHWSVNFLADKIALERSKFMELFRKVTGMTVMTYLFEERMKKAVALIRDTTMKTKQIAKTVGYKDASNFLIAFKRKFKSTPGTLRKVDHDGEKKE